MSVIAKIGYRICWILMHGGDKRILRTKGIKSDMPDTTVFLLFYLIVRKLSLDGTYAGNDSIVAFARNNAVNVVIHQLNAPMWTVSNLYNNSNFV